MGEAISEEGFKGLTKYGDKCTAELNKIVSLVRGQLTSLERATCGALVTIDVHARDITVQVQTQFNACRVLTCLLTHAYWFTLVSRLLLLISMPDMWPSR